VPHPPLSLVFPAEGGNPSGYDHQRYFHGPPQYHLRLSSPTVSHHAIVCPARRQTRMARNWTNRAVDARPGCRFARLPDTRGRFLTIKAAVSVHQCRRSFKASVSFGLRQYMGVRAEDCHFRPSAIRRPVVGGSRRRRWCRQWHMTPSGCPQQGFSPDMPAVTSVCIAVKIGCCNCCGHRVPLDGFERWY